MPVGNTAPNRNAKRCPQCLPLRSAKDSRYTCARCATITGLAHRAPRWATLRQSGDKSCVECAALVAANAAVCPACGHRFPAGYTASLVRAAAAALIVALGVHFHTRVEAPQLSPLPRVSYALYAHCLDLSTQLKETTRSPGIGSRDFFAIQNKWHGQCSRKALRTLAEAGTHHFPTTPDEWLALGGP